MKKILIDSEKNFYKANMHCHSIYSDGKQTVEEIKKAYLDKGYSVVAFTDHEHLIDNSHLNDENFLAITSCEIAIKQFDDKSTLEKLDMKVCHLNFYSMDEHNTKTPCYNSRLDHFTQNSAHLINLPEKDYKRVYGHEGISEIIRIANKEGFLVSYNHPNWSLEDARDYLGYRGIWAVEIFNYSCHNLGIYSYNTMCFDDFLRENQNVACIMGDDNHNEKSRFGGYVMINAEKLEYGEIMRALKDHCFYASQGPEIKSLYIEGNQAHIAVGEDARCVIMTTGTRQSQTCYIDENTDINDIVLNFREDHKYIRFDVVDEYGKRANTCAYFV